MTEPVFAHPKEKAAFDPTRFSPKPLFESPEMKVIQAAFRAGQFIPSTSRTSTWSSTSCPERGRSWRERSVAT